MELNEALRRIVLGHAPLIAASVIVALALAGLVRDHGPPRYTSSARLVLDATPTPSVKESLSLADGARALVTSQSLVQRAVDRADVDRDARDVAENAVSLKSLGASDVMRLSTSDTDPEVARRLTDALAAELIAFQGEASRVGLTEALTDVDLQLAYIAQDHGREQARALSSDLSESAAARMRLQSLERQIADLSAQRVRLLTEEALRPRPVLVDSARLPTAPDPSGMVQLFGLAGVIGLVVGLGGAGTLETLRPRAFGPASVAASIGGPLLACLRGEEMLSQAERAELAISARLAATTLRAEWLVIMAVGDADATPVVAFLRQTIETESTATDHTGHWAGHAPTVVTAESESLLQAHSKRQRAALLVVAPSVLSLADLDRLRRLQDLTSWPIAGTVMVPRRRLGRRRRRNRESPTSSLAAQLRPLAS